MGMRAHIMWGEHMGLKSPAKSLMLLKLPLRLQLSRLSSAAGVGAAERMPLHSSSNSASSKEALLRIVTFPADSAVPVGAIACAC